jgi:hypothetical protein
LREVAYAQWKAIDRLLAFLETSQDRRLKQATASKHDTGSLLACFGVHRCSGCGGDPEWFLARYGYECKGCGGRGYMHEEIADPGVTHTDDSLFPGFGFTVRWKPGLFGKREPGWTPKWMMLE